MELGRIYDSINSPAIPAKSITIPEMAPCIYISENRVLCYIGAWSKTQVQPVLEWIPEPIVGMHTEDKYVRKLMRGFFQLESGGLYLSDFLDAYYWQDELFKEVPAIIRFPKPAKMSYAVLPEKTWDVKQEYIEELERRLFGLTSIEIEIVLKAYGDIFGLKNKPVQIPRLTFSTKKHDYCRITEQWIPSGFPCISFSVQRDPYDHVSLLGLYRHLQLVILDKDTSIASLMMKNGVPKYLIETIMSISPKYNGTLVSEHLVDYLADN